MSGFRYFWANHFPPKPKWATSDIPDLTGKVAIVTGANTGIGKETAKALLEHNATVYLAGRNSQKIAEAIADLKASTGKEGHELILDLANLKSIKKTVEDFQSRESRLDMLFNNGGVMVPPIEQVTADGYDLQFGTNVIGHFYLTKLLLPLLISTAANSPEKTVRVINTSSYGHAINPNLDFNTFKDGPARKKAGTAAMYGQSKFGNVMFSNELARRYGDKGIVSTSLHPGSIITDLQRNVPKFITWILTHTLLYPAPYGALTQLRAGTDPQGVTWNGKYLVPWARVGKAHPNAENEQLARELWDYMEEQTKDI